MKKFLVTTLFATAFLTSTAAIADSSDVLAKVNGREVTKNEINNVLKNVSNANGQAASAPDFDKLPPDVQKAFVDKYIDKVLIIDAAEKENLGNDPQIVQKLAEAKEFLIQEKYLNDLVDKQRSDEKMKKLYDEKVKTLQGKQEVHAEHILVKTEDEAKKLKAEIDKGGDFEKLAKANSTEPGAKLSGGDLGYFTADQMVPEFSKVAFNLKVGEVSAPVQTPFGWHLIKVLDKRPIKIPTFAEYKPTLQRQIDGEAIEDNIKKLKSQATIEYYGTLAATPAPAASKPEVKKLDGTTK